MTHVIQPGHLGPERGSVLERLALRGPPAAVGERCELCSAPVGEGHGHVVDLKARGLMCSCRPCYLLFTPDGAGDGQFRSVPDRCVDLGPDAIGPQQWDQLEVPVSVAFFFHNSILGHVVGLYPGPGGATESELPFATWSELVDAVPLLASLEPDVEAVLVRGGRNRSTTEAYIVPIDCCYELTGRLRSVWKGIDGGSEAGKALDTFFAGIVERSARSRR